VLIGPSRVHRGRRRDELGSKTLRPTSRSELPRINISGLWHVITGSDPNMSLYYLAPWV
jgi:hypothetical protein